MCIEYDQCQSVVVNCFKLWLTFDKRFKEILCLFHMSQTNVKHKRHVKSNWVGYSWMNKQRQYFYSLKVKSWVFIRSLPNRKSSSLSQLAFKIHKIQQIQMHLSWVYFLSLEFWPRFSKMIKNIDFRFVSLNICFSSLVVFVVLGFVTVDAFGK